MPPLRACPASLCYGLAESEMMPLALHLFPLAPHISQLGHGHRRSSSVRLVVERRGDDTSPGGGNVSYAWMCGGCPLPPNLY